MGKKGKKISIKVFKSPTPKCGVKSPSSKACKICQISLQKWAWSSFMWFETKKVNFHNCPGQKPVVRICEEGFAFANLTLLLIFEIAMQTFASAISDFFTDPSQLQYKGLHLRKLTVWFDFAFAILSSHLWLLLF